VNSSLTGAPASPIFMPHSITLNASNNSRSGIIDMSPRFRTTNFSSNSSNNHSEGGRLSGHQNNNNYQRSSGRYRGPILNNVNNTVNSGSGGSAGNNGSRTTLHQALFLYNHNTSNSSRRSSLESASNRISNVVPIGQSDDMDIEFDDGEENEVASISPPDLSPILARYPYRDSSVRRENFHRNLTPHSWLLSSEQQVVSLNLDFWVY
jgi:hypothetical protein